LSQAAFSACITLHEVNMMNTDHVKGAINDAAGRAKRQVGEWTGDENAQIEGSVQQLKGKAQKIAGDVKDAALDANKKLKESEREFSEERARRAEEARKQEEAREEREHAHHTY
jgi:uncharacterized protein YjbJ (UPF0337 family)